MLLRITAKQSARIKALIRKECCNLYHGNCLLLDDGEECACIQFISRYGVYCKYFQNAVLPMDKELCSEIMEQNKRTEETT